MRWELEKKVKCDVESHESCLGIIGSRIGM